MAHILADRVLESSTSSGTGPFTTLGAVLGFRPFSAVCAVTDTIPYYIEAVDGQGRPTGDWEFGLGTYSAANQLTRTTVRGSSNAGLAVAFSSGTKLVGLGIAAPNSTATRLEWRDALSVYSATQSNQMAGLRNLLINGNFAINQRAYVSGAAVGAANTYTLDRWRVVSSGQSLTFSASGNGNSVTAPAGGLEQVIEGLSIAGGSYVLNWTGTATATVGGTARTKGEVFTLTAGSNVTVRFTGGTVSVAQLEPGTVATPFEARPYGMELALCQRYYEPGGAAHVFSGSVVSGGTYFHSASFKVTKRITPTMVFTDFSNNAFPATAPTITGNTDAAFVVAKVANSNNGAGSFQYSWTANAEL